MAMTKGIWHATWMGGLLAIVVFALYAPVLGYEFTNYDEVSQVIENPLIRDLSPAGIGRMFSSFSISSYYPVRLLSFALDYAVWGLNPLGFHLTNVLIHTANALLLFAFLLRFRVSGFRFQDRDGAALAALCAGVFALHPVVVEPVAWVAGREELLTVLFTLCALHVFGLWRPDRPASQRLAIGLGTAGLTLCACLSNVVGAMVPAILAAYAVLFPDAAAGGSRRDAFVSAFRRTWPLWLIGLGTVGLKFYSESWAAAAGVTDKPVETIPLLTRMTLVPMIYALNWQTLVWPRVLHIIYPPLQRTGVGSGALLATGSVLALGTLVGLWRARRRPVLLFGGLWMLLAMAPSAHVVAHHIIRADRLLYPAMPAAAAVLLGLLMSRRHYRRVRIGLVLLVLVLSVRTVVQLPVWRNGVSLFSHVLKHDPKNVSAVMNRGIALCAAGRAQEGILDYRLALELKPNSADTHMNLGGALLARGQIEEGLQHFKQALTLSPDDAKVLNAAGAALIQVGRTSEGLPLVHRALDMNPDLADAYVNLGVVAFRDGRLPEAAALYERALTLYPELANAQSNLGAVLYQLGRVDEALIHYRKALALDPKLALAYYNLSVVLADQGKFQEAADALLSAKFLAPGDLATRRKLAEVWVQMGRIDDALYEYGEVIRVQPDAPDVLNNMGVLHVHAGRYDKGIRCYHMALQLTPDSPDLLKNLELAESLKKRAEQSKE